MPSPWRRIGSEREMEGMRLRVAQDTTGRWRFSVARQGQKPHINGTRGSEISARGAAKRMALASMRGEQQ